MNNKWYKIFLLIVIGVASSFLVISIVHYSYLLKAWINVPVSLAGDIGKLVLNSLFIGLTIAAFLVAIFNRHIISLSLSVLPTIYFTALVVSSIFLKYASALTGGFYDPSDLFCFAFSIIDTIFISVLLVALFVHISVLIVKIVRRYKSPKSPA